MFHQVPVLPVALIGAHEAMPKGSSWPRWGRPPVVVALGEPMRHRPNESVPSFNERIQATVRSLYAQNRPLIDDPDGMAAGLDKNYVKDGDTRVIAHTKIIGSGEKDSVTFDVSKLKEGEQYMFFCTFPGHSALMKGTLTLK